MTDPAPVAADTRTSWRWANITLIVLALVLAATATLLFTRGAAAAPGDSEAETLSRHYAEVRKAASNETLAFLTVDHTNMDPLIAKVISGATGTFKEQYEGAKVQLKSSAEQAKAVSTGKVRSVGIADIDDRNAVAFVAADSQVTNASTKGRPQPRYYRLKLTMVRKGDAWLASNLQFVN